MKINNKNTIEFHTEVEEVFEKLITDYSKKMSQKYFICPNCGKKVKDLKDHVEGWARGVIYYSCKKEKFK